MTTEYQPPTGGTTEQEILKQVPCSFYARTPGERREATLPLRWLPPVMGVIRAIDNLEYQTLLELRYLCFYSWEKIAVEMDYDLRYMHKLHRKALEQCTAFIPAGGRIRGRRISGVEMRL